MARIRNMLFFIVMGIISSSLVSINGPDKKPILTRCRYAPARFKKPAGLKGAKKLKDGH